MFSPLYLLTILSLSIWLYLIFGRGWFWLSDRRIKSEAIERLNSYPNVWAIVPARNEADVISQSLTSLLQQQYAGKLAIVVVDDRSTDGTGEIARSIGSNPNLNHDLTVIFGDPLPSGWTGKLWAMEQGINYALAQDDSIDYFLLTDADIQHDLDNLHQLVTKAETENLELVSLMVLLRCNSFWEKLLIPAFVFFFQKLYPFPLVNNPQQKIAAAAGGCILVNRRALARIGGMESLQDSLIDDCTLAAKIKNSRSIEQNTGIWLGLTKSTISLRPYPDLTTIWDMVARTAYDQLKYSPFLLVGTAIAMVLIYLVPLLSTIVGFISLNWFLAAFGGVAWSLMIIAYLPTLKLYDRSPLFGFCLPLIASLYTMMTLDSALRYYRGQGGAWKGRVYPQSK
jgi:hopene-associated glycosyltransferase HpnB